MLENAEISRRLATFPLQTISRQGLRPAAVLVPLYIKDGEEWTLLTRRTDHLNHHRGEISFPGGAMNATDENLTATALRESEEEMGIRPRDVTVLGRLDDFYSVHGYHVVPFVGRVPHPYRYKVNSDEIAEVIELPLSQLRDPAVYHEEDWTFQGRVHPVSFYTAGRHVVWGLTAAILKQFFFRVYGDSAA